MNPRSGTVRRNELIVDQQRTEELVNSSRVLGELRAVVNLYELNVEPYFNLVTATAFVKENKYGGTSTDSEDQHCQGET